MQTAAASDTDTARALAAIETQIAGARASCVFVFYGQRHDDAHIHRWLSARFPGVAIIGGTSCGGFMTDSGVWDSNSIGLLLVDDESGEYGAASGPLGEDAAATAEALLGQALASCGCAGQLPEVIWIYQQPGREEQTMMGLRRVVGDRCAIVGGSSADDDVSGQWRQLGPEGVWRDGMVVCVLFPSAGAGCAFQGGYEPAGPNGVVTRVAYHPSGESGTVTATTGRELLAIDDRPAAEVYREWTGEVIPPHIMRDGGTILAATTMCPIAVDAGRVEGVTHYLLVHPESVSASGSLTTFCEVSVGSRVFAMKGERRRLVERAGRAADLAHRALDGGTLAGCVMVYCAGCKLAVGESLDEVAATVAARMQNRPFIGCFTFGEQGQLSQCNVHGNLMISAVAFAH
ncbi:FIST signal transduction protein [Methyloversatilis thermotolerans]|uniref:FIST signal transduction protein n=1 Tax=Methyloversatilis thermotolerans TaxID=1346290 RepID=UPI000368A8A3|nr:FIST N-terminal domain-containing protein [Methyloversatilis thermotolerans]